MIDTAKALILIGCLLVAAGAFLLAAGRLPWLGRLPGDILIQRKNVTVFIPLATSLLLSAAVSLVLWLWSRR